MSFRDGPRLHGEVIKNCSFISSRRSFLNEKVASAPLLPRLLFQGQNSRCDANCSCQRGHKFIADDFFCGSSGRSQTKAGCKLVSSRPVLMSAEIVKSSFKVTQDACYYSFDKGTPPKLPRGGRRQRAQEIPPERAGGPIPGSSGRRLHLAVLTIQQHFLIFHRQEKTQTRRQKSGPTSEEPPWLDRARIRCGAASSSAADGHLDAPGERAETPKPPGGLINCHSSRPTCPRFNEPHADNLQLRERENHQMIPERSRRGEGGCHPNGEKRRIVMRQEAEKGTTCAWV